MNLEPISLTRYLKKQPVTKGARLYVASFFMALQKARLKKYIQTIFSQMKKWSSRGRRYPLKAWTRREHSFKVWAL